MEALAKLNNCPMSPRKMRLVADQIRGVKVENALNILKFSQKPVYAEKMEKLLLSAISNWKQKSDSGSSEDDLVVKEVFVDQGRSLKRIKPAPQGRAHRVRKRSNHITLIVSDNQVDLDLEETETENN